METDNWKIPKSRSDRLAGGLSAGILAAAAFYLWANWQAIPQEIPTHYGISGQPDAWGDKSSCVVVLVVGAVLWGLICLVERVPAIWNTGVTVTEENREHVYRTLKHMLVSMRLALSLVFSWLTVWAAQARPLGVWFLPLTLLLVLGPMTFFLIRLYRKSGTGKNG